MGDPSEPTGILTSPADAARELIASSATFQSWTGTGNEAIAKKRVYLSFEPSPTKPFAMAENFEGGIGYGGYGNGEIPVMFEADIASEDEASGEESTQNFLNIVGAIIKEVEEESRTGDGRLYLRTPIPYDGYDRSSRVETTQTLRAYFRLPYGLET